MKVGDLIKCGGEFAIILDVSDVYGGISKNNFWLECLWSDGEIEGIESDDVEYHYENR
jgi:hypothetical protein